MTLFQLAASGLDSTDLDSTPQNDSSEEQLNEGSLGGEAGGKMTNSVRLNKSTPYDRPAQSLGPPQSSSYGENHESSGPSLQAPPYSGPGGDKPPSNKECRVYVGNLSYEAGYEDLKEFMKQGRKSWIRKRDLKSCPI